MTLEEHVYNALQQLKQGETIGRRETPVISHWPMRTKWEKWGETWESMGTDGDIVHEGKRPICPAVLKLVYFRHHDSVCQLAYIIHPEESRPENMQKAVERYNEARSYFPTKILDT